MRLDLQAGILFTLVINSNIPKPWLWGSKNSFEFISSGRGMKFSEVALLGIMCTLYVIICVMICKYARRKKSESIKRENRQRSFLWNVQRWASEFYGIINNPKSGFINFIQLPLNFQRTQTSTLFSIKGQRVKLGVKGDRDWFELIEKVIWM